MTEGINNVLEKLGATKIKVKATFIEEVLGTNPGDPELHDRFIASQIPDGKSKAEKRREEIEALGEGEYTERSMTVFSKTDDFIPHLWNYQIKGFFKDACKALRKVKDTESAKVTAYKAVIDGNIFITERKILIQNYNRIGECQRSLRADTPQGERTALAHSETVPAGSFIEFTVCILPVTKGKFNLDAAVREWLDYGSLRGLGQWRNSGKGAFVWEEVK